MTRPETLRREFEFYVTNQNELVKKYNGRYIVIKDEEVLCDFAGPSEAYWYVQDEKLLGKALIQLVGPGEDNYTLTVNSSLIFA